MISVAFFNNKGGVGKTTLLCNLAAFIGRELGKRILIVDADPQTNATQYMFDEEKIDKIYASKASFTVHSVAQPLSSGKGFSKDLGT